MGHGAFAAEQRVRFRGILLARSCLLRASKGAAIRFASGAGPFHTTRPFGSGAGAVVGRSDLPIFILIPAKGKYFILRYASHTLRAYSLPSGTTTTEPRHKKLEPTGGGICPGWTAAQ